MSDHVLNSHDNFVLQSVDIDVTRRNLMLITLRSYRVKSELAVQAFFLLVDGDIRF